MAISHAEARGRLTAHGQAHVLRFWDALDTEQRARLLAQIETLDFSSLADMQRWLTETKPAGAGAEIQPAPVVSPAPAERQAMRGEGEALLRAGQVGVILVAGGQGSRLGFEGPKGCLPLAPITQATLFAIHARKVLALGRQYGVQPLFCVMTSEANDAATREFFQQQRFFGLNPQRVRFFRQGMWPALFPDGSLVMERPDGIFMSPDGHGGVLAALNAAGLLAEMARGGVTTLFYFQVDNPLVDVADPAFIGLHRTHRADVSVKVCAKRDPEEGLGVVVARAGRTAIVEYTELTPAQKQARRPDGELTFRFGSVAIHAFSVGFLTRIASAHLPLHVAHKKVPYCDERGNTVKPQAPNAYKFERFIFDVLPLAETVLNVEFQREDEFSPVKNATGHDSPETARRDLMRKHARWLEACGIEVPRTASGELKHRIEIDPAFASGPEALRVKLDRGLTITGDLLLAG